MTTELSVSASSLRLRWRKVAIPALFLLLGIVYASWASRIPSIRDALQLDAASLSLALLCGGLGAVASFPLAAWLKYRAVVRQCRVPHAQRHRKHHTEEDEMP